MLTVTLSKADFDRTLGNLGTAWEEQDVCMLQAVILTCEEASHTWPEKHVA